MRVFGDQAFLIFQIVCIVFYFSFSFIEFYKKSRGNSLPSVRFTYLPLSIIAKTAIRFCIFSVCAIVLYLSEANIKPMALVILLFLINDVSIFLLRWKSKNYFIALDDDHIFFQTDKQEKVFISRIKEVEFRHNIFYFTMISNSVRMLEMDIIEESQRENFKTLLVEWMIKNKLVLTDEAKQKLSI